MGLPRQPAEIIILIKGHITLKCQAPERASIGWGLGFPCGQLRSVIKLTVFKMINTIKPLNHPDIVGYRDYGGLVLLSNPFQ